MDIVAYQTLQLARLVHLHVLKIIFMSRTKPNEAHLTINSGPKHAVCQRNKLNYYNPKGLVNLTGDI